MKSLGETIALGIALLALGCIVGHCTSGCSPAVAPLPRYCYDSKEFTAALLLCVDKSATREQSRACRKQTHADCGIVETVSAVAHE